MNAGQSFAPIDSNDPDNLKRQAPGQNGVQEAIKLLSLRLPRATMGGSPIPQGLLMGQGGGLLDALKRILQTAGGPGGGLTSLPTPNVIPGIDTGEPAPGTFHPGTGFPPEPAPGPAPAPAPTGGMSRPMPQRLPNGRRQPPSY